MVAPRGYGLPNCSYYEYDPRPPRAENPPITIHEFRSSFSVCGGFCILSWLPLFHRCLAPSDDNFATRRIPKRICRWELKAKGRSEAWGLAVHLAISAARMVIYHILMIMGTFIFWIVWQAQYPEDQPTALAPAACMLALLSMFWSAITASIALDTSHTVEVK